RSAVNGLWDGLVWGFPTALALSAAAALLGGPHVAVLLTIFIAAIAIATWLHGTILRHCFQGLIALSMLGAIGMYVGRYGVN
ncbi:MAG TPA: hypothetical protein PLK97_05470, partial [Pseudomonadales bacterium]|nr:hypothetical protein [Pseudomonadales bacterium]